MLTSPTLTKRLASLRKSKIKKSFFINMVDTPQIGMYIYSQDYSLILNQPFNSQEYT